MHHVNLWFYIFQKFWDVSSLEHAPYCTCLSFCFPSVKFDISCNWNYWNLFSQLFHLPLSSVKFSTIKVHTTYLFPGVKFDSDLMHHVNLWFYICFKNFGMPQLWDMHHIALVWIFVFPVWNLTLHVIGTIEICFLTCWFSFFPVSNLSLHKCLLLIGFQVWSLTLIWCTNCRRGQLLNVTTQDIVVPVENVLDSPQQVPGH